jgi:hypothetical protein
MAAETNFAQSGSGFRLAQRNVAQLYSSQRLAPVFAPQAHFSILRVRGLLMIGLGLRYDWKHRFAKGRDRQLRFR